MKSRILLLSSDNICSQEMKNWGKRIQNSSRTTYFISYKHLLVWEIIKRCGSTILDQLILKQWLFDMQLIVVCPVQTTILKQCGNKLVELIWKVSNIIIIQGCWFSFNTTVTMKLIVWFLYHRTKRAEEEQQLQQVILSWSCCRVWFCISIII